MGTWGSSFQIALQSIHQLTPRRIAHCEEIGRRLPTAMRETQHGAGRLRRDRPRQCGSHPFGIVTLAAPNNLALGRP